MNKALWQWALEAQPSARVQRAMVRLSRNRWLSGKDVLRIGMALAEAKSAAPHQVFRAAIPFSCCVNGMFRGRPPFPDGTREATRLAKHKSKCATADMLLLLELASTSTKKDIAYEYDW